MRSTTEKVLWAVAFVAIVVLVLIAAPSFIKARNTSCGNACINNLRMIDAGKEQAALANKWDDKTDCDVSSNKLLINSYIKGNSTPLCPDGGTYSYGLLGENPTCSKCRKDDVSPRSQRVPGGGR